MNGPKRMSPPGRAGSGKAASTSGNSTKQLSTLSPLFGSTPEPTPKNPPACTCQPGWLCDTCANHRSFYQALTKFRGRS